MDVCVYTSLAYLSSCWDVVHQIPHAELIQFRIDAVLHLIHIVNLFSTSAIAYVLVKWKLDGKAFQ